MKDSSVLLRKIKIILKVFNKLTYFFTCKSSVFQKHFENEMFFLQYYHKVRYFTNKNLISNKKINQEMNFLILWFLRDKTTQMNLNCKSILQNFKDTNTYVTKYIFFEGSCICNKQLQTARIFKTLRFTFSIEYN